MIRCILLLLVLGIPLCGQDASPDYAGSASFEQRTRGKVFRERVSPHWMKGGDAFWYRNDLPGDRKEYVIVNAVTGERRVAQDAPRESRDPNDFTLRPSRADSSSPTALRFVNRSGGEARLFWVDHAGRKQSYGSLKADESREQHTYEGHVWAVEGADGIVLGVFEGGPSVSDAVIPPADLERLAARSRSAPSTPGPEWRAFVRDNNVWIRRRGTVEEVQLSQDGIPGSGYREPLYWSPDGTKLVALRVEAAQERKVYLVESSPQDQLQPKLQSYDYLKPGDRIAHPHPQLFDLAKRQPIPVSEALFPNPWELSSVHWAPDSSGFYFLYNERGHQVERLLFVDAASGNVRTVLEEKSPTFIDYSQKTFFQWLDGSGELLWMSERDGWNHLYLIDARSGTIKAQLTRGEWNVRSVERVDEERRQIWMRVMGVNAGEDPYHFHLARVNMDGSGFLLLTQGDGTHTWEWSPDRRRLLDTWSRVDAPPVTVLRDAEDGRQICELERADISALQAAGWRTPERFVGKGRDGVTDIYGVLFLPARADSSRRYPVIEQIYAGPHDFFTPKAWGRYAAQQALAELGFVVVQIDGMGTNWRGRAFHDVCWKNLKDAGFPDRIAWMRAAAAKFPEMDLDRVGVYGGSAGGQNALGALLFHGDFYKAAVADCGCHDNRMDKIWWNEAWMGWPVGPEYADNSNVTHAAQLRGSLMLVVGELDKNVDPASTMQVVNALIRADKDFDLLVIPGAGHGAGGSPYGRRRRDDFFVRHLLRADPAAGRAAAAKPPSA